MRKKLLCMLLSVAMVSTATDSLALAAEHSTQLQTETESTQGETSLSRENTAAQTDSEQEPAESDTSKDKETDRESEEKESETETEVSYENMGAETEPESSDESTDSETEPGSSDESADPETEPGSSDENADPETEPVEETRKPETEETQEDKTDLEETDTELQAEYHSIDEITEFLNREKAGQADDVTYAEEPNLTVPYHAGALSDTTLESAAGMIRQIRFIAGLPYEITLDDEYNHSSQAAALLSYVNGELSRDPSKPEGMSEELFEEGCDGAANAGLAYCDGQSQTLNEIIVGTWMADDGEYSLRGQLLKPSMEQVGFGAVKGSAGMYSAMYTADHPGEEEPVFGVAWPARNMPVDYFDRQYPWSVSTGETLKASDIHVTLTRESDGKKWTFSEEKSDGLFAVDNDDSGQGGCIIFRPRTSAISEYADGDIFEVEITRDEKPYLNYRVRFFALSKEEEEMAPSEENPMDEDITVQYTVTFESNGGTIIPAQLISENEKASIPEEPTKEGYFFDAWYQEEAFENKWDFETNIITQDTTLYAKWDETAAEAVCTVSFDMQGQGEQIEPETVNNGEMLTEPASPAAEDYLFAGWYREADCINVWNFETDTVESDLTLYANWISTESGISYLVTYDMQGIGEQIAPEMIGEGEMLVEPDIPAAEGYIFAEWYQEPECINLWDFKTDTITRDTVLYAKWIQENEASVKADDSIEAAAAEERIDLGDELTATKTNNIPSRVYNGKAYEPSIKVTAFDGKKRVTLKNNKDYTLKYANNIHAGVETASVTITGMGKYTGSVTRKFTITPKNVKKLKIYTGSKLTGDRTVSIVIYDGTTQLSNGLFLAEYIDAQDPKKAKLTITPKPTTKDYTGSVTSRITVYDVPKDKYINSVKPEITGDTLYTGKAITRNVKIEIGGIELRKNKDYKVQYKNNINAGTAMMTITGKGQYKGKIVSTFNIGKVDLNKKEAIEDIAQHVTIADISPKTFNGKEQKPAVIIKTMRNKKLAVNKDYTATYSNNIHSGIATVTIAGIGNNCNGKTTVKFKIEPQQIKKATVKLIKGKNDAPNTVALTYNKKTLQEYADYIIVEYGEMKNKKIPVTIEGRSDFTGSVTKQLSIAAPEEEPGSDSASASKNINRQNYGSFEGCVVNSYLQKNDDGSFMRVEHIGQNSVCIESYSPELKFADKKIIKMELPKFGGFYSGRDYNFLVFGKENPQEDNTVEVIRIVKYDKNWERVGSVGIFGGNTVSPFKNGSLRMVEYENTLYIRTCHQMYRSSDGGQHQANVALSVDIPTMEILEQYLGVHHSAYSSHSFNQFVLIDDSILLTVDHGDAYPRSVALAKYGAKAGTPGILGKGSYSVAALKIEGNRHNPATGVSVGGFEASDTAYLIAGNSVEQDPATYTTGGVRNIYVTSTRKDDFSANGNKVHWITDHGYIEYTDADGNVKKTPAASVSTPQLVKINGNEMMLLWTESTIAVENNKPVTTSSSQKCVLLDGAGEPVSGIYSFEGPISDCKPIVDNGRLVWYYTNNSAPVFCTLNISDVRNQPK